MMSFSDWILPCAVALIVLYGLIKKVRVFECFVDGAKNGLKTFASLLPALTALVVGVSMLTSSGGLEIIKKVLTPVFSVLGIPEEVIPLCVISPVSGSGSLSVFENILATYGPDSFVGRVASVIAGATETTFYAVTVYYGAVGVRNSRYTIPCAIVGDAVSCIMASFTVKLFFQ